MKRSEGKCGTCVCYLTDEDEHGNITETLNRVFAL